MPAYKKSCQRREKRETASALCLYVVSLAQAVKGGHALPAGHPRYRALLSQTEALPSQKSCIAAESNEGESGTTG